MSAELRCRECEQPIPPDSRSALCPRCLLKLGLEAGQQETEEGELRPGDWTHKAEPKPGDILGDYVIVEKVGGNMGLVFRARHRLLDKVVALKLLPTEWTADPARRLERFQREIRVLGQLQHPNLVTAADARIVDAWHLVVMEWIDGVDLNSLVWTHGPLPVAEACEAARQAALGLQCAHQHSLIHRDIKPSNLMLTRTGTVKVIDLGLALIKEDSAAHLTRPGGMLGTASYCAPEQFREPSKVDIRADIYSLGCTLYHLLTGKPPYWQRKTFTEVMLAHLNDPFPRLTEARPDIPAGLERVLARMVAKDPNARFATPHEVAAALEPFAQGANLKALGQAKTPQGSPTPIKPDEVSPIPEGSGPKGGGERQPKARWACWADLLSLRIRAGRLDIRFAARWARKAGLLVLLALIPGAALLFMKAWNPPSQPAAGVPGIVLPHEPVVVLMDTTATNGVYDADNRAIGASNADELQKLLQDLVPLTNLDPERISATWARETPVISRHPELVIVHRSAFFHTYNAEFKIPSPTTNIAESNKWQFLYDHIGDERLITLMGIVGSEVSQTRFLVYSRGTDKNWLNANFRSNWVEKIEARFPKLKDRITTMVVTNDYAGTFRDQGTAKELRAKVKALLKLPEKRD